MRWDTEHGFHVPELFCKDCDSLEDMIRVRGLGLFRQCEVQVCAEA